MSFIASAFVTGSSHGKTCRGLDELRSCSLNSQWQNTQTYIVRIYRMKMRKQLRGIPVVGKNVGKIFRYQQRPKILFGRSVTEVTPKQPSTFTMPATDIAYRRWRQYVFKEWKNYYTITYHFTAAFKYIERRFQVKELDIIAELQGTFIRWVLMVPIVLMVLLCQEVHQGTKAGGVREHHQFAGEWHCPILWHWNIPQTTVLKIIL